jgi:hypothetical protein
MDGVIIKIQEIILEKIIKDDKFVDHEYFDITKRKL